MEHNVKLMAAMAALTFAVLGAFVMIDTDATYETTEYGEVYNMNLAPGYKYTYTPTYPEGLEVTTTIEKFESEGLNASVTNGTLTVQVKNGITSGSYDVVIKATSSTGGVDQTIYQHLRFTIVKGLTMDETANFINDVIKGAEVTFRAQASTGATTPSGNPLPITWAVTSGKVLPAGLALNGDTVSGTPEKTGMNTVYLTASSGGQTADLVVSFTVWQQIVDQTTETITSYGNTVSSTIVPQSVSSEDDSGDLTLTWTVKSGTMPAGFTLDPNTGIVSGSSTESKTTTVTIEGTHTASGQSVQKSITIRSEPVLNLTPSKTTVAVYTGAPVQTVTFQATEGISTIAWTVSEATGVSINAFTGELTISNTAVAGDITVTATTQYGQVKTSKITVIQEQPLTITGDSEISTVVDTPKTVTYTSSVPDVTWSVKDVPVGTDITIDQNGKLTLNDNNPSECTIKVVATSDSGQTVEFEVTCKVIPKLMFTDKPTGGVIAYAV